MNDSTHDRTSDTWADAARVGRAGARDRDRSRRHTRPGRPAATVLVLGLVLLGAAAAEAQTPRILVSNSAQGPDDSADTSGNDHAQLFHTGANTGGYILTSVRVNSEDPEDDAFDVEVCEADTSANEFPTSTCTALTAPGDFTLALPEFTHAGIALSANTNYVVVIKERSSASVELNSTTSGGEDTSLGLSGWSIKDYFYWNNSGTWTNQGGQNEALRIIVNGYETAAVVIPPVVTTGTQIWSATLTTEEQLLNTFVLEVGYDQEGSRGSLDDDDFDLDGTSYTVTRLKIQVPSSTNQLLLSLDTDPGAMAANLTLHIGTDTFPLADATTSTSGGGYSYLWTGHGLSWADTDMISVALTSTYTPPPAVTSVELVPYSIPTSGIGVEVETLVFFSAAVDVTGTPQLELDFAGTPKAAACGAATNTTTLVCGYTVVVGDSAPNGIAIAANTLTLNGGTNTATGSTTDTADLAHAAVAIDAGQKVDGIRPTLVTTGSESPVTSTDGTQVILTFSEDISAVTLGSVSVEANNMSGYEQGATVSRSGRTVTLTLLSPSLTIAAGWTVAVALSADAVEDAARNGNLALAATAVTNAVGTTPVGPTVAGVALASDPGADNTCGIGDSVEVTVTFSVATNDAVDITGTPQLELDFAGAPKTADCLPDTGTISTTCIYTVVAGDSAPNGIAIAANTLTLNGGTITSTRSTTDTADLAHAAVAIDAGQKVDGIRPTLVTTGSESPVTSTDGTQVILTFSEDISAVTLGSVSVEANNMSGYEQGATVSRSGRTVTLTLLSPSLTIAAGWTVIVALSADAVEDDAGNGNLARGAGVFNAVGTTNTAPTFANPTETRSVAENSPAGTDVGNAVTATDGDNDPLTYTLEGDDAASFAIIGASGQIHTRSGVTYDYETTPSYTVIVKADDNNGGTDTVTIDLTDVDEPPRAPAAPTVTATPDTTDSLSVRWRAPSNTWRPAIDSYDLQYREGTSGSWTDGPQNVSGTSATITGLTAAPTAYRVQVRATNSDGDGPWSPPGRIGGGGGGGGRNDPPLAVDDAAETPEDTPVTIAVLDNDSDPDGDTLTVVEVSAPTHSTAVVADTGAMVYTPEPDVHGTDRFTYVVGDGSGLTARAAVEVTVLPVNDPPLAGDDGADTPEDTSVTIAVLDNDSDPDGDTLTVVEVSAPTHGTAVVADTGAMVYTPEPDVHGPDRFTCVVGDGSGLTAQAAVDVTVLPVNDPPLATGVIPDQTLDV